VEINLKKLFTALTAIAMSAFLFTGCAQNGTPAAPSTPGETENPPAQSSLGDITVISREDGSGTRGAFIELLEIQEKDASGNTTDKTTSEAVIANSTDVVMTQVAGNEASIGYISLGSLNNTVKALKVDGVEATATNVKAGTYKVARPFNIATKGAPNELAQDFIDYILSAEGQDVVSNGYIKINESASPYSGSKPAGKIVVAGSSSVTPIMEKLKEAYLKVNTGAEIEIQQSDSSAGMKAAIDGVCDIGMASRELKDSEKAELTATSIALDGIAVVVNPANPLADISAETVKNIYVGEITSWDEVK
jgi:phosphate transport system substrate-binding protein